MSRLWRDRNFLRLWIGQTISEIGSRITREGLPLTAYALHATPAQMGLLSALGGIAALIASPIAGIAADRYRRKPLMVAADLGRALALGSIPVAAAMGTLSLMLIFIVISITGVLTVFFDVAYQTMVPSLVKKEDLLEANTKLALTASTAEVIGPALTGVLVQTLTAPRAILLDAVSFLVSAVSILMMRDKEERVADAHSDSGLADTIEGFRFVARHPVLRPLALRAGTFGLSVGFISGLYILFAVRDLSIQPGVLGLIIAVGGVSNFCGAVLSAHVGKWLTTRQILIGSSSLGGFACLLIPLAEGPVMGAVVLSLSQLIGDLSFPVYSVQELTLRQRIAPPDMLGRVNACGNMLFKGTWPLGALAGGVLATSFGIRTSMALGAVGACASVLWLVFSKIGREKTTSLESGTPDQL